jgi:hypothetical protein
MDYGGINLPSPIMVHTNMKAANNYIKQMAVPISDKSELQL